jgi:23S rRNA (cytosine1962-C5)-methyltransferase
MTYTILDSGNFRKLEKVGPHILDRPALNAFWPESLPRKEWEKAEGKYERNSSGGGRWFWHKNQPLRKWKIEWGGLQLLVKPTNFGHLGFFAEQAENWEWLRNTVKSMNFKPKTLSLFAYSGGSSLAMAQAGAKVCHSDAAKGMTDWGKANLKLNPDIPEDIRWITDDVLKFTAREVRRNNKYNGIVLDPPTFGRGPKGELWKIEEHLNILLENCVALIDRNNPHFILLSCHSPGFSPFALKRLIKCFFGNVDSEIGEMKIKEAKGEPLPAGVYARFMKND